MRKYIAYCAAPVLVVGFLSLSTTAEALKISCSAGYGQCTQFCNSDAGGHASPAWNRCLNKCAKRYHYCMTQLGTYCPEGADDCLVVVPAKPATPGNNVQRPPVGGANILDAGPTFTPQSPAQMGTPLGQGAAPAGSGGTLR